MVLPAAVVVLALLVPVAAIAGGRFGDVQGGSTHAPGIGWVADHEITLGCNPAGTLYCPNEPVSRAQMATFMRRLADATSPGITTGVSNHAGTTTPGAVNTSVKVADLGTFTKQRPGTRLEVSYTSNTTISNNIRCHWQVRIDGRGTNGSNATTGPARLDGYGQTIASVASSSVLVPMTFAPVFTEVSAGNHTLELWVERQFGSGGCSHNLVGGPRAWHVIEVL